MPPYRSIMPMSFHRDAGSTAYGMEDALPSENLLTESVTHMWQHVLSWEDWRGWDSERGASVSLMSLLTISLSIRPSSVPRPSVGLNLLESYKTALCPVAIMSLLARLQALRAILHNLQRKNNHGKMNSAVLDLSASLLQQCKLNWTKELTPILH